jgi:hypothetical protein
MFLFLKYVFIFSYIYVCFVLKTYIWNDFDFIPVITIVKDKIHHVPPVMMS